MSTFNKSSISTTTGGIVVVVVVLVVVVAGGGIVVVVVVLVVVVVELRVTIFELKKSSFTYSIQLIALQFSSLLSTTFDFVIVIVAPTSPSKQQSSTVPSKLGSIYMVLSALF